jgi:hypothetical protein
MSHLDHHTRLIAWAVTTGTWHKRESIKPCPTSGPNRGLTDDDLLLLSIWWVKVGRRDGSDFVRQVALVFCTLKAELEEAALAEAM